MRSAVEYLYCEGHGQGIPMLFLHPKPADHDFWMFQRARFSAWYQTLAIDLPGYGLSPPVSEPFDFTDVADACWRALDAAKVGRAIVVGLSIGSRVAQHMAAQQPRRTMALVLTGGGYFSHDDSRYRVGIERTMQEYEARVPGTRRRKVIDAFSRSFADADVAQYVASMYDERAPQLDLNLPTILRLYELLLEPVPDAVHKAIVAPTLVITGDQDPGHLAHRELARRLGADVAVVEGSGHFCNIEQPWTYDRYLAEFLDRHGLGHGQMRHHEPHLGPKAPS